MVRRQSILVAAFARERRTILKRSQAVPCAAVRARTRVSDDRGSVELNTLQRFNPRSHACERRRGGRFIHDQA